MTLQGPLVAPDPDTAIVQDIFLTIGLVDLVYRFAPDSVCCEDRMATAKRSAPNEKVALYERLLATIPLERKGAANPYTSLNGNMFTLLHQSQRLAIRLPEEARAEFLKKYKTRLFEAYGAVMSEYVAVPDALLENTKVLQKYLAISYEYAKTLKPKPTKKKH